VLHQWLRWQWNGLVNSFNTCEWLGYTQATPSCSKCQLNHCAQPQHIGTLPKTCGLLCKAKSLPLALTNNFLMPCVTPMTKVAMEWSWQWHQDMWMVMLHSSHSFLPKKSFELSCPTTTYRDSPNNLWLALQGKQPFLPFYMAFLHPTYVFEPHWSSQWLAHIPRVSHGCCDNVASKWDLQPKRAAFSLGFNCIYSASKGLSLNFWMPWVTPMTKVAMERSCK